MKSKDPLYPYQNLFITARPGMGASTLVANIVNKYLDEGKKCLIFDSETRAFLSILNVQRLSKKRLTSIVFAIFLYLKNMEILQLRFIL